MARINKAVVIETAFSHWESFHASRSKALLLQKWLRGEQYDADVRDPESRYHGRPYYPRRETSGITDEYDNLARLTPNSWADLVVRSLTQTAYIEGIRMPGSQENLKVWETMMRNRWLMKQSAIHRTAIGLSTAYGVTLPGVDPLTGDKMARMTGHSPTEFAAWYNDDDDEWAYLGMRAIPYETSLGNGAVELGWQVTLLDEQAVHYLVVKGDGWNREEWTYISFEEHPVGVAPVARCVNRLDLDGHATGEIEPVLPLLRRIDQGVFDRLIVQRFGAWKVRYITGMAKPKTQVEADEIAIKLRVEDFLAVGDPTAKVGTLDASDPKVYSEVTDADLRMLAAITQTPPHHLLGLSSNLQAEALAAAESGLQRKSKDFKLNAAEFHEQMARMCAKISGDTKEAAAWDMQVRWADTESRSMTQAADALGKIAVQLKVPVEMLWEKIPGWTDSDVQRAKELIESGDTIDRLLTELALDDQKELNESKSSPEAPSGDSQQ